LKATRLRRLGPSALPCTRRLRRRLRAARAAMRLRRLALPRRIPKEAAKTEFSFRDLRTPPLTAPSGAVFFGRENEGLTIPRHMAGRPSFLPSVLFIFYCAAVGVYLLLRPWSFAAGHAGVPGSGFFRGFVSGLGLLHIAAGVA